MAHKQAQAGKLDEAIVAYRASLELVRDSSVAIDLAVALLRKGDAPGVVALLSGESSPVARYQTALAYAKLGRHEEACSQLELATHDRPDFVEAWYQLGVSSLASGKESRRSDSSIVVSAM